MIRRPKVKRSFISWEDFDAIETTLELSGLEIEFVDKGIFSVLSEKGKRLGLIALVDNTSENFEDLPDGVALFSYEFSLPGMIKRKGRKHNNYIDMNVEVSSRKQFLKELRKMNQRLINNLDRVRLQKFRRKNPVATGTLMALGLGFILGSKK